MRSVVFCTTIATMITCTNAAEISEDCSAAVHSVFVGCPTLIRLLNLTKVEDGMLSSGIIRDIGVVLDQPCCQGLKILQDERCLCDEGFLSLIKSGKDIDGSTLDLLTQSIYFECSLEVDYGSDCVAPSHPPLTTHQQLPVDTTQISAQALPKNNTTNDTLVDYRTSTPTSTPSSTITKVAFEATPPASISRTYTSAVQITPTSEQQVLSIHEEDININSSNNSNTSGAEQEYLTLNSNNQSLNEGINGNSDALSQVPYEEQVPPTTAVNPIRIQHLLSTVLHLPQSKVDSTMGDSDSYPQVEEGGSVIGEQGISDIVYFSPPTQVNSSYSGIDNLGQQEQGINPSQLHDDNSSPSIIPNLQDLSNIVYQGAQNFNASSTQQQPHIDVDFTAPQTNSSYNVSDIIYEQSVEVPLQLSITVAPENDTQNVAGYEEVYLKGEMVLKSADQEIGQLEKQPLLQEPTTDEFSYSQELARYVELVMNMQQEYTTSATSQAELQSSTKEDLDAGMQEPVEEPFRAFRSAHRDCNHGVVEELSLYKNMSIFGECLRQSWNKINTDEFLVTIAPSNPGVLSWLRTDAGISLVELLTSDDRVSDLVGQHTAIGQPLNLKAMASGQSATLMSLKGTPITISMQGQDMYTNNIKVDTIRYTCNGIILFVSVILPSFHPVPLPLESQYLAYQQQQYSNAYRDEAATLYTEPAQAQFKLPPQSQEQLYVGSEVETQQQNNLEFAPYTQQQEVVSDCDSQNVFTLLKEIYPGFAYLASQQGLEDLLTGGSGITVFIPNTIGGSINVEDYVMTNNLQQKGIAWLGSGSMLEMLSGAQYEIQVSDDQQVSVGGAKIIAWDKNTCNGVVHVLENQFFASVAARQNAPSNETSPDSPPPTADVASPPSPLTFDFGEEKMSLIRVDSPQEYLSTQQIYSIVTSMMKSP